VTGENVSGSSRQHRRRAANEGSTGLDAAARKESTDASGGGGNICREDLLAWVRDGFGVNHHAI